MKQFKLIYSLLFLTLFSTIFASNANVTDQVNTYVKGLKDRDTKAMGSVISEDVNFVRINKILNKSESKNKKDFLEFVKSGSYSAWATEIDSKVLDVQDNIAIAMISYGSSRLSQTEYITLVNEDGKWVIVNSVCNFGKK